MSRSVIWFRKDLRLHDNPALIEALRSETSALRGSSPTSSATSSLLAIFVIDPWFANPARIVANRYNYLLEALKDLDASLRARGSRLVVLRGSPSDVVPTAVAAWRATRLVFEEDIEPYARAQDAAVSNSARAEGVRVTSVLGHTLWSPAALEAKAGGRGKIPLKFESFLKVAYSLPPPPRPVVAPSSLPLIDMDDATKKLFPDTPLYNVPTLASLGFDPAAVTTRFKGQGGETAALATLAAVIKRTNFIERFEKPLTDPTTNAPSTTGLSPALRFGTLGAREMWWRVADVLEAARAAGRATTGPPTSLAGQLLWREFFYAQAATIDNWDRMEGNRACRLVDWGYDPTLLRAWEESGTGFPYIDACMAQLRGDGWLHHLARHAVACFLTRGDLYQSWEHGARIFDRYLLDSDWALNNGNWLWLSGTSTFFTAFFRVYSPITFAKKYDPEGNYIRKWLPKFARFPAKYIYEPWTAPRVVQEAAGVVIGRDYPPPVVDHAVASKHNVEALSRAYAAHREGAQAAAAIAALAPAAAKGAGQTQMGSDENKARGWAFRMGVTLGEVPGIGGGGGGGGGQEQVQVQEQEQERDQR